MTERLGYDKCRFDDTEVIRMNVPGGMKAEFITAGNIMWPTHFFTTGFAPDIRENLKCIQCMKCRNDDVILCAYPRSGASASGKERGDSPSSGSKSSTEDLTPSSSSSLGTHWVWEICNMLLGGKAEYQTLPKHATTLEYHWPEEFESMTSPRVFNTHLHYANLPREITRGGKGKVVFVTRNPKDVAVSLYHHAKNSNHAPYKGDFKTFLEAFQSKDFMYKWFDYTKEFDSAIRQTNAPCVHVIHYEALKQNPEEEIRKLADFLEVSSGDDLICDIMHKCSFRRFKEMSDVTKENNRCHLAEIYKDPKRNIRKGEIGNWKDYFTVSQSETFDTIYDERMTDTCLNFTYSTAHSTN